MAKRFVQERGLPTQEERRRILEQARSVLAEARALAERLDRARLALLGIQHQSNGHPPSSIES